jgi:hypothetical protein
MGAFGDETFNPEETKEDVAEHLERRFPDLDSEQLREVASETVDELAANATVTGFIATVAEHEATERLRNDS